MKKFGNGSFALERRFNGNHSVAVSLRQTFQFLVPVFMIGAFSLCLQYFPVSAVRTFIQTALNGWLLQGLELIYEATYGFAAVYLVMVLSFYEAQRTNAHRDVRVFSVICSVACYFGFMGTGIYTGRASVLNYTRMANIFSAILVTLLFSRLFFALYHLFYRNRRDECATSFERGIRTMLPFVCCLGIAVLLSVLIELLSDGDNFNDLVIDLLNRPFESLGSTFFGGFAILFTISFLWMFGIHGSNVFDTLLTDPTGPFAVTDGSIVSKPFLDTFALMGGCGTAICLLFAVLLFGKSRKNRRLSHFSLIPVFFNINETLIFGFPIVLNPIYAIPFVLTPLLSYSLAYGATALGWVPQIVNTGVQWTTPIIISGYQATGSVAGSVLQIVLLIVGIAVYAPFVRLADRMEEKNTVRNLDHLTECCRRCEKNGVDYRMTWDNAELHNLESDIASKLSRDIQNGEINLYYQPQVRDGKIIAAEALLRFSYRETALSDRPEFLYPPLVVGIANNYGLFDSLSRAVVLRALTDLTAIRTTCEPDFCVAVNLRLDLLLNADFRQWLLAQVKAFHPSPRSFGVEITEDIGLISWEDDAAALDELKAAGILVFMDDFSMGNTSIVIMQKSIFDCVKIDGSLIRNLDNERSRRIVASIIQLGQELQFSVIAEYVETPEQRDMLAEMGCSIYQGYLYYPAIPIEELTELLRKQTGTNARFSDLPSESAPNAAAENSENNIAAENGSGE